MTRLTHLIFSFLPAVVWRLNLSILVSLCNMKRQSCPGMIINPPPPLSRDSESKKENGRHYHRKNDGHLLHHQNPPNEDVSSQRPYYPFWEKMFQHFNQVLHHQRFIGYCVWMNQPITMQIISVFDHLNLDNSAKIYDKEHIFQYYTVFYVAESLHESLNVYLTCFS